MKKLCTEVLIVIYNKKFEIGNSFRIEAKTIDINILKLVSYT